MPVIFDEKQNKVYLEKLKTKNHNMKKNVVLFAFLLSAVVVYSQKMKVKDGNIKNLKGITSYKLEFDYSDLSIPK